jgi:hypothetical protein
MPDYGHDLELGYFLPPDAGDPDAVVETAVRVDRLGYDLLGVQDHPYQRRHLDTLSLLGCADVSTGARMGLVCGELVLGSNTWPSAGPQNVLGSLRPRAAA